MLSNAINAQFYGEWLEHVKVPDVRDAFIHLVGAATTLKELSCHARFKGVVRDFRFVNANDEQPFSFIVNQKWLLFYFRASSVRSGQYSFAELIRLFPAANENSRKEWTIRLTSVEDIRCLLKYLQLK